MQLFNLQNILISFNLSFIQPHHLLELSYISHSILFSYTNSEKLSTTILSLYFEKSSIYELYAYILNNQHNSLIILNYYPISIKINLDNINYLLEYGKIRK